MSQHGTEPPSFLRLINTLLHTQATFRSSTRMEFRALGHFLRWAIVSDAAVNVHVGVRAQSLSRVRLCDPTDCSPPGPSVRGILQARTLQ